MSRVEALARARRLREALQDHGVRASIELQPGRSWTGDEWYSRKVGLMNHHTAGPKAGLTPCLWVVKHGRPDLPGPLCNGYGGRDLVYRVITLGLANHPGEGGPLTLAGVTIPRDSARPSLWGTEWEHDGVSPWPDDMQEFMGRSNAALLEWMGRPVTASIEHSTWAPDRKIDRNGYSALDGQIEIRRWAGERGDDMPTAKDLLVTAQEVESGDKDNPRWSVAGTLRWLIRRGRETRTELARLRADMEAQGEQLDRIEKALTQR